VTDIVKKSGNVTTDTTTVEIAVKVAVGAASAAIRAFRSLVPVSG
jgi:hypothetical protein